MKLKDILKRLLIKRHGNSLIVGRSNEQTRVEWLKRTLNEIPSDTKILDAGADEQQFKSLCAHLEYTSQDFAEYKPSELEDGLQKRKWDYGDLDIISDIADIPRKDNFFDTVMCTEVFEHIINPRETIKEFSRLLKTNGILIITAPFCSLTHFAPYHFYSGFNRFFYETELPANGFEILEITPNGNYFEYLAQELNRLSSVSKRYSNQKLTTHELNTIKELNKTLQVLSENDTNSSELLCFGYHVLARKR